MAAVASSDYQKLKDFTSNRSPKRNMKVSKFSTPKYNDISKLDDVTRFNSSHYCVTFYQDYPKRDGTPIKVKSENRAVGYRRSTSPKVEFVKSLFRTSSIGSDDKKKELFAKAMGANLRSPDKPKMQKVTTGTIGYVLNDFHIRETNPGFARNELGRIYNH